MYEGLGEKLEQGSPLDLVLVLDILNHQVSRCLEPAPTLVTFAAVVDRKVRIVLVLIARWAVQTTMTTTTTTTFAHLWCGCVLGCVPC